MRNIIKTFLLLAGLAISNPASAQWVTADVPSVDFGFIPQFGKGFHHFWLRSQIDDTLIIGESKMFCDCLKFQFVDSTIAPGDSVQVMAILDPKGLIGEKHWVPAIYTINKERIVRIDVKATVFDDPSRIKPVIVEPMVINASWFGDSGPKEYKVALCNVVDATIPLRLIEADTTYYDLEFPTYIDPGKNADVKISLKDRGIREEFEESITFEYIDNVTSAKEYYTIPVKRRIFKHSGN
jgi:hypothetical protein